MKLITRLYSFHIPSRSRSPRQGPDRAPGGYALMVMLIAVTVMTIGLLTALPSAFQEARREREEELLFRGNQYAQAVYLFQKHFNRYPNSVKELLHTDNLSFLRKAWPDPATPGGKWRFIHASGAGAVLDSWTLSPTMGASPLGQNGQNGMGTTSSNGSNSGFGAGQSGSSGFGNSSSFGPSGLGGSNSTNSGSSGFSLGGGASGGGTGASSSNDFGWPPSGAASSQSGSTGQQGGSWDTTGSSALPPTGTDQSGTPTPGSPTPGSTALGAADSVNSLSPAALHAEAPGRPLDANGKPKMSPDCLGGIENRSSSLSSSSPSNSSSSSSSNSSSSFSSSSSSSFSSSSSLGAQGSGGSSSFSLSSQSPSSFGSPGSNNGPLGTAIVGLASCSDQTGLRIYNKHHRYSEWEFIGVGYNPLGSGASTTPVQSPGQPGQAGSGQQGQGSSSGFGSSSNPGQTNQTGTSGSTGAPPGSGAPPTTPPQPPPTPPDQPPGP